MLKTWPQTVDWRHITAGLNIIRSHLLRRRLHKIVVAVLVVLWTTTALAHPEDEFCVPGESNLDPELCRMLAELDAQDGEINAAVQPILDSDGNVRGAPATAALYITIGVRHILPGGLDHILFVLAIFLAASTIRALVIQVSAFTVAHTATLGLAAAGVITPPAHIVEPLIAATIAFVAIENLVFRDMTRWRPAWVFGFGLIHGLGFAGFFGELGLPPDQFWSALIGFNVGVEVGQLLVIAAAAIVAAAIRRRLPADNEARQFRHYIVVPGSLLIGAAGLYWTVERLLA